MERLTRELESVSAPATPTLVEVDSGRSVLQLMSHDIARAAASVSLLAPPDAYPLSAPALRRPFAAGGPRTRVSPGPGELGFAYRRSNLRPKAPARVRKTNQRRRKRTTGHHHPEQLGLATEIESAAAGLSK